MNLKLESFSAIDDYTAEDLPSAAYAPAMRAAFAKIHAETFIEDLSFRIVKEDRQIAGCLMAANRTEPNDQGEVRLWSLGSPILFWHTGGLEGEEKNVCRKWMKNALKERLAAYPRATVSFADYFQDGVLNPLAGMLLERIGMRGELSFTHVVDLRLTAVELRTMLRDRYKATINKGLGYFKLMVIDATSYEYRIIHHLHQCHMVASGRDVYPESFWSAIGEIMEKGAAYLVLAKDKEDVRGASLFVTAANKVYYCIGAYDRSLNKTGLSHASIWFALLEAKRRGYRFFETGRNDFASLSPAVSEKEMTIGHFKRGFGGDNRPVLYLRNRGMPLTPPGTSGSVWRHGRLSEDTHGF